MPSAFQLNYRDLVEGAGDIIYALDLDGCFVFYNSKACEVFGYDSQEGIGRHLTDILTTDSARIALEHFRAGIEGRGTSPFFEVETIRKDGTSVHLEVRATNLYRNGELVGRQGIARDITELKLLQEEVAQKTKRLALLEERDRIARELYESMARIVFKTISDPLTMDGLLNEVRSTLKSRTLKDAALSGQDLTIIELVAQGLTNEEIGRRVSLAPDTVKGHIRKMMERFNVTRRTELAVQAARRGLI